MRYFVRIGERELEVAFEDRDGEVFARVREPGAAQTDAEQIHRVSYAEVDGLGQYSILVDGKSWAASIEPGPHGSTQEFSVGLAGETWQVAIENERERAARATERPAARGPKTLRAVMPGIVIAIVAKEGETVAGGAPLVVLEAMKMQNEVRADAPARVARIHVAKGKTVAAGDPLVTIEPE
ncbi:MAG TPA: biotin/lipoyl-containing protein [Planctomycetota bacterium]|nr:biotin/lipoyl-containing protein [Planctomycetota bacterium]